MTKKNDNVFLVLSLFYYSQMVDFEEKYHFSRFQRGSNTIKGGGGPTFSRWGSNCLFPIETQITCDFPGGVRTPFSLWIRTCSRACGLLSLPRGAMGWTNYLLEVMRQASAAKYTRSRDSKFHMVF